MTLRHPNNGPLYTSVKEAARLTGLSDATIRKLIAEYKIPHRRMGKRVLIPTSFLTSFEYPDTTAVA